MATTGHSVFCGERNFSSGQQQKLNMKEKPLRWTHSKDSALGKGLANTLLVQRLHSQNICSAVQILYTVKKKSYECTKHQKLLNYQFLLFILQRIPTGEIPYLSRLLQLITQFNDSC